MVNRVNGFHYLLTDEYPPFGGADAPEYPIRIGVPEPLDSYSRMKALFPPHHRHPRDDPGLGPVA